MDLCWLRQAEAALEAVERLVADSSCWKVLRAHEEGVYSASFRPTAAAACAPLLATASFDKVRSLSSIQRYISCEPDGSGLARGDREWPVNEGRIPNFRGVRVALGTGYNRVRGIGRVSRKRRRES